ncbi:Thaumatin-like protein 1 [Fulvia fulva]|uniref:Thaumatin-like protein 1 n=1 Tax=Passalora fulva TaxID=5499 RepID=A0A9Q8LB81_PASFU|nr:Thaumatin-like protein 1 [Fulvia fulva]UJO14170.1 Thaumatin-like protein 1 [Fulvia fulva]
MRRRVPLLLQSALLLTGSTLSAAAHHHSKRRIAPRQDSELTLTVSNLCTETIWPGMVTQAGNGPTADGFELAAGANQTVTVASNWQGRIWGRTNCSFHDDYSNGNCMTGECGPKKCRQAGNPPATLAEFTMLGDGEQSFYDLSLVDGYNLDMAIVLDPNGVSKLEELDTSTTNPSCIGSANDFDASGSSSRQQVLGISNKSVFEDKQTAQSLSNWCPFDLLENAPKAPGDGVYPYPGGNVQRPAYQACNSACEKYKKPKYCCTGSFAGAGNCANNYYGKAAKAVCPDAYSFPNDDQQSTFIIPAGGTFNIVFCPGGRSTNLIGTGKKVHVSAGSRSALLAGKSLTEGIALSGAFLDFGWWFWCCGMWFRGLGDCAGCSLPVDISMLVLWLDMPRDVDTTI